jgi:hypothetical protein
MSIKSKIFVSALIILASSPDTFATTEANGDGSTTDVNCMGEWTFLNYQGCSVTCGGGRTSEIFVQATQAHGNGDACLYEDGSMRQESCNIQSCENVEFPTSVDATPSESAGNNGGTSVEVSSPSTKAILALGIIGLVYRRFKQQS